MDPHYTLSYNGPDPDAAYARAIVFHTPSFQDQAWVTPPTGSAWVGPSSTTSIYPYDPSGYYSYRLSFDVSGIDLSLLQIGGWWATDNSGQIFVNGGATGSTRPNVGFDALAPFVLQGFTAGQNTIEFRVYNESGPSGLLVTGLRSYLGANYTPDTLPTPDYVPGPQQPVPEPSTYLAGALLLVPFGVRAFTRLRRRGPGPESTTPQSGHPARP